MRVDAGEVKRTRTRRLTERRGRSHDPLVLLDRDPFTRGEHLRDRSGARALGGARPDDAREELARAAAAVREQADALTGKCERLRVEQAREREVQRTGVHVADPRTRGQRWLHLI